ncbi:MAG: succinyl-CoA synthetase subunit beta [Syntrophaceae bacterium PtaB.Bin095]|nr:MAG: succinyl-CoA synthetase subunit beta [Syntrophaceae bacterium PtaB.Bin095]
MNRESALHVIDQALREGRKTLSEYEAKQLLAAYRIPVTREILVRKRMEVRKAAMAVGYPLVMKGCSAEIAHKTERGLIRVDLRNDREALKAFDEIKSGMDGQEGDVLMQELIQGRRELVMGMTRDDQFGPCVMFGLGGIFTEILRDVAFRRAPLEKVDALALMDEIRGSGILDAVRGMNAADRGQLADMLIRVGRIGLDIDTVREIDLNPVILRGSEPVVVDALVILN